MQCAAATVRDAAYQGILRSGSGVALETAGAIEILHREAGLEHLEPIGEPYGTDDGNAAHNDVRFP